MTTTYDPQHPAYLDEADARIEMSRVFDVCRECRLCTDLCPSFPELFDVLDGLGGADAGMMTPGEQDRVVDSCSQCSLCVVRCPYVPGAHPAAVDFPRLMRRATAVRCVAEGVTVRGVVARTIARRADLVGAIASAASRIVNRVIAAPPRSLVRRIAALTFGLSDRRLVAPFSSERFSAWFARRPRVRIENEQGAVAIHPTCIVEHRRPDIGRAIAKVFEHNGVRCETTAARCCGAPLLRTGDLRGFTRVAIDNVAVLAADVRRGVDVVVAQPECVYVIRREYVDHVGGPDAQLVADHTFDPCEYLMRLHRGEGTSLDTNFPGVVPATVAYHASGHLRALGAEGKGRDVLKLTGARVVLIEDESGGGGRWGLRVRNAKRSIALAKRLGDRMVATGADVLVGDCHYANTAVVEQTGRDVMHPLQVVARAYGSDGSDGRNA